MSALIKKELPGDSKLGVWRIQEDSETLLSKLQLSQKELDFINTINSGTRYIHWLASRVMLRDLLGSNEYIDLRFDKNGKPLLKNFDYNVSISHSGEMAAVLISKDCEVGLDIEQIQNRIERVAHKFISRDNLDQLDPKHEIEQMYVYWCAKEALYKLYSKKKLRFREDLPIEPFKFKLRGGVVTGKIIQNGHSGEYEINYQKFGNDYIMAYVLNEAKESKK